MGNLPTARTLAWAALGALALGSVAMCSFGPRPPEGPPPWLPCNQRAAQARLSLASRAGVIRGVDAESDGYAVLIVRRGLWDDLSLDSQKSLVSSADCRSGGVPGGVHVREEAGGDDLATFDVGAVIRLRDVGFR